MLLIVSAKVRIDAAISKNVKKIPNILPLYLYWKLTLTQNTSSHLKNAAILFASIVLHLIRLFWK
jgi:hypothetical protein